MEAAAGERDLASAALREAEELAQTMRCGPDSEAAREIATLRAILA
jgi:hypothetical protein